MTWKLVFQIICLITVPFGGGSALVIAVTKWASNLLSAKIKADIENEHKKEMEAYKAQLSNTSAKLNTLLQNSLYITQKQFDLEMEIYRKAWKALIDLIACKDWVKDYYVLNEDSSDENKLKQLREKHYEILKNNLNNYQETIEANAPFYQETAYMTLREIAVEFNEICDIFLKYKGLICMVDQKEQEKLVEICSKIDKEKNFLVKNVRDYLYSLNRCLESG
jgi:hypothetical protein